MKLTSDQNTKRVYVVGLGAATLLIFFLAGAYLFFRADLEDATLQSANLETDLNSPPSLTPGAPPSSDSSLDGSSPGLLYPSSQQPLAASEFDPTKFKVPLEKLAEYDDWRARIIQISDDPASAGRSLINEFLEDLPEVKNFLEGFPKEQDANLYLAQMDSAISLITELYSEALSSENQSALSEAKSIAESLTVDTVFTDPSLTPQERQIRAGMIAQLGYRISSLDSSWLDTMQARLGSEEGRALIQNIRQMQQENLLESAQENR